MKKYFKFIVVAVAAVAMIGCTKDGANTRQNKEGVETTASIKISLPAATRAFDDVVKTQESKIVDAWAFIFDRTTERLRTKVELDITGGGTGAEKNGVRTTSGDKIVFVAVNAATLTNNFSDGDGYKVDDAEAGVIGITLTQFMNKVVLNCPTNLPAVDGYFLMTGYNSTVSFLAPTASNPTPNGTLHIGIGRGVAKVNMVDAHTTDLTTVKFQNLAYKVINNPIKMRAFQKWSQVQTGAEGSGTIVNEIVGDGSIRTDYYYWKSATSATDYTPESNDPKSGVYVPENWNTSPVPKAKNATTLLIQAKVMIQNVAAVLDKDGVAMTPPNVKTYTAGTTFYRVWQKDKLSLPATPEKGKWLDVFFGEVPTLAAIKFAAGIPQTDTSCDVSLKKFENTTGKENEFFIATYTDAFCYWTLPLKNPVIQKSVVARNDYFWVTIQTIANIGASTDNEDDDNDGILPENPDLDEVEVDIDVIIDMLNWHGVEQLGDI